MVFPRDRALAELRRCSGTAPAPHLVLRGQRLDIPVELNLPTASHQDSR